MLFKFAHFFERCYLVDFFFLDPAK
jgi:hypothetical protein